MDPEPGWLPAWGDWEQDPDVVEGQPGTGTEACPSPWSPLWAERHCLAARPWGHPCSAGGLGLPISIAGLGWQPCASGWGRGGGWCPSSVLLPREGRNPPHPLQTSAHRSPDFTCSGGSAPVGMKGFCGRLGRLRERSPAFRERERALMECSGRFPGGEGWGGGLRCDLEVTEEPAPPDPLLRATPTTPSV